MERLYKQYKCKSQLRYAVPINEFGLSEKREIVFQVGDIITHVENDLYRFGNRVFPIGSKYIDTSFEPYYGGEEWNNHISSLRNKVLVESLKAVLPNFVGNHNEAIAQAFIIADNFVDAYTENHWNKLK